jgi:hypothetical protein
LEGWVGGGPPECIRRETIIIRYCHMAQWGCRYGWRRKVWLL